MQIEVKFTNMPDLQKKLARLEQLGLTKTWLGGVGEILQHSHEQRHKKEEEPGGSKWELLSEVTKQQKKHPDMLYETGDMLNSLSYQMRGSELLLGFSEPDEREIYDYLEEIIEGAIA